ncbi:MAG: hypothetical protein LC110_00470 [Burkholderiales bacterium]|nr:hypothetical protein [Burkholderiales bacterium]
MQRDFFPHLLPRPLDDDELARVAEGILRDWFRALCYRHSEAAHQEILESLSWRSTRALFFFAALVTTGRRGDFSRFAGEVRRQARRAREAGLVVASRRRARRVAVRCRWTGELAGVA